jgi:hypothetical protein
MSIETGTLSGIYVAANAGEPMYGLDRAFVEAGRGISNDRYAEGRGAFSRSVVPKTRHISLIAAEAIAAANEEMEFPYGQEETRRNLITVGIELNDLVDQEFSVGNVAMRGVELCDPCRRPEKLTGKSGFEKAFDGRGGLRAEVLTSGLIIVGDKIQTICF